MIDDYVDMLRRDDPPDPAAIMRRRLAFSNAYLAHVAAERDAFRRLRTGDPDHRVDRLLDEHGCRLRRVMPGYSALIEQWTPVRILAEWSAYRAQVLAQIQRYFEFIAWEEAEILPLLDDPAQAGRP